MDSQKILRAFQFRHACKLFDAERDIPVDEMAFILETGRLSPSSFGMEPWRFRVVKSQEVKEELKPLCWNQNQITSCSHLLIITARSDLVDGDTEYVRTMFGRRGLPEDATAAYVKRYQDYIEGVKSREPLASWVSRQCYIALGNMMTSAAMIGIDSCPIEGFEKKKVEKYLKLDTANEQVAVIVAFGYRVNPQPAKKRLEMNELVRYL
jgi:nitroreductase